MGDCERKWLTLIRNVINIDLSLQAFKDAKLGNWIKKPMEQDEFNLTADS